MIKSYRIKLFFENKKPDLHVPYTYRNNVVGFLYKHILDDGKIFHDNTKLYSISPLLMSTGSDKNGLFFKNGTILYISTPDVNIFKKYFEKSLKTIGFGINENLLLRDVDIVIEKPEKFKEVDIYYPTSIFLNKNVKSKNSGHLSYNDEENITTQIIKLALIRKIAKLGISITENDFDIKFDLKSKHKKTNMITYKGTKLLTSQCPIYITASDEIKCLIYSLGIGLSCGIGFGFINTIK